METLFPGMSAAPDVHPALVHFPLALWVAAALLWVVGVLRRSETALRVGLWNLLLGVALAAPAIASGWAAMLRIGEGSPRHDVIQVHRNWMLAATASSVLAAAAALWSRRSAPRSARRWIAAALIGVTAAVATLGADRGALLVYGRSRPLPSAATASYRAVPFMLSVAPSGTTKRTAAWPTRFAPVRQSMVTGIVVLDDSVENAMKSAGAMPRACRQGGRPPKNRRTAGSTTSPGTMWVWANASRRAVRHAGRNVHSHGRALRVP